MPEPDVDELARDLLERLEERGLPQGAWLIEIDEVRDALHRADAILLRLHDAIVRAAEARHKPFVDSDRGRIA
jgi:hypothetical protein